MNKYFRKLINLYLYKSDILLWWTTNLTNVFVLFAGIFYEFRYSRAWNIRTIQSSFSFLIETQNIAFVMIFTSAIY